MEIKQSLGWPAVIGHAATGYGRDHILRKPERMGNMGPQIRNMLKCNFVERVVISNHNPNIKVKDIVGVKDDRLIFLSQNLQRA